MSFYELLCEHYDEIFPASGEGLRFVNTLLETKPVVLDLGCGTGNKTAFIAEGRRQVLGIDADAAMIEYALRHHAAENISYLVMDMAEMELRLSPASFDAVTCLGNTIPHLTGPGALFSVFCNIRAITRPDGFFIGQLLNYERIIAQNITELPVVETDRVVFRRLYEWRGGVMYFTEELRDKATGTVRSDSVEMLPTLKGFVEGLLYETGYEHVEFFGGLDGQPYDEQSYHVVFKARMNPRVDSMRLLRSRR